MQTVSGPSGSRCVAPTAMLATLLVLLAGLSAVPHIAGRQEANDWPPSLMSTMSGYWESITAKMSQMQSNARGNIIMDQFVMEEFEPPPGMPNGTKCSYIMPWIENALNQVIKETILSVTEHPVLSSKGPGALPIAASVKVGVLTLAVSNLTIIKMDLAHIRMGQCVKPDIVQDMVNHGIDSILHPVSHGQEDVSSAWDIMSKPGQYVSDFATGVKGFFVTGFETGIWTQQFTKYSPQWLPDAYVVRIEEVNLTEGLVAHYDGVPVPFTGGMGAFDVGARSDTRGWLEVTAFYSRPDILGGTTGNDNGEVVEGGGTKITACKGNFNLGHTDLTWPMGVHVDDMPMPVALDLGPLICWGPAAALGPLSGLVGLDYETETKLKAAEASGQFVGLAPMLNTILRKNLPVRACGPAPTPPPTTHSQTLPACRGANTRGGTWESPCTRGGRNSPQSSTPGPTARRSFKCGHPRHPRHRRREAGSSGERDPREV